jgi:hypothetical protein
VANRKGYANARGPSHDPARQREVGAGTSSPPEREPSRAERGGSPAIDLLYELLLGPLRDHAGNPLEGEDVQDNTGWRSRRPRRLQVARGKSQLDSAECWLRVNDPAYANASKVWKHVKRGGGAYRPPREGEVLLAPLADHADEDAPLDIAAVRAGQYAEPKPITQEERMKALIDSEARDELLEGSKWQPAQASPVAPDSRAEKFEEVEQVIRWDLAHPERFERAHGERLTVSAVAKAHNVSRDYVHRIYRRMKMPNDTGFPRLIDRVNEQEARANEQDARITALEREVGLPVGGDRAVATTVERLIDSTTSDVRVIRADGTEEILPQDYFDAKRNGQRSTR